jgi:soluble lytic murein transglycosylase
MPHGSRRAILRATTLALAAGAFVVWSGQPASSPEGGVQAQGSSALWIVPEPGEPGSNSAIARAVQALAEDRAAEALPGLTAQTSDPVVGGYALLYKGRAELALKRPADALTTALALIQMDPRGYLGEAAGWLTADAAEAAEDWAAAERVLRAMTADPHPSSPASTWLRLGTVLVELGDRAEARSAFERVRHTYALTPEARAASDALESLLGRAWAREVTRDRLTPELDRAHRLFAARRYADANAAYAAVQPITTGDDRDLVRLRLAECEYFLGRHSGARTALNTYVHGSEDPARVPEARFYFLSAQRALRQHQDYIERVADFVRLYPDSPFAEQALDDLGTHYILQDEDASAAETFADLYRRYPRGRFADRAAWKSGWWAYKAGRYADAIRTFESAFETFDRADYRPSWLYWSARAHAHLGDRDAADAGYARVIGLYRNSYYGREAARELEDLRAAMLPAPALPIAPASRELPDSIAPGDPPPNADFIRRLLAEGLYGDAILELRRIQREAGNSPVIDATIAWALSRVGDLRASINTMRRAYPQFMATGGEALPVEIRRTIFPIAHWDLIGEHSAARRLDPFLMTALIAQESTFQADVRSAANAWGLMQIIPGTGRRVAADLGIRPFRTSRLTDPEVNVRIGMKYFSDLIAEFRDPAPALAAYNAGEHRVRQWLAERPGMARDEFIDDIPFPETQNYVKRVIGTSADYRALYAHLAPAGGARSGR